MKFFFNKSSKKMIVEIRNQKGRKWRVRRRGGYLPERLRVFSHGGWNRDSEIENHCQLKITADGVPGEKTLRQGTKPGGGKAGRGKLRGGGGERKREGAKRRDETPAWTEAERRRESRGGEAGNEPATEAQVMRGAIIGGKKLRYLPRSCVAICATELHKPFIRCRTSAARD